jgi:hypothetical protein
MTVLADPPTGRPDKTTSALLVAARVPTAASSLPAVRERR